MPLPPPLPHASGPTLGCFWVVLIAVTGLYLAGVWRASRQTPALVTERVVIAALVAAVWLGGFGAVVQSGVIAAAPMPRLLLLFATVNIVSVAIGLSPLGHWLASGLGLGTLVAFQAFRLPLELVLHLWVEDGVIPATMTWTGANWDVLTGAFALLVAPLAARHRRLVWTFNSLGLLSLLNVIRVAVFSSPLPFAWPVEPPLTLALALPYAFIAPICVGGALIGHVVLFRALCLRPRGLQF